jgi:hypothetical protein
MAGLRHHEEAREPIDVCPSHPIQHRLKVVELCALRRQRVVGANGDDHLAASLLKRREVRVRRIEDRRQLLPATIERPAFHVVEWIGGQVLHQEPDHTENPQVRVHRRALCRTLLALEPGAEDQPAARRIGVGDPMPNDRAPWATDVANR